MKHNHSILLLTLAFFACAAAVVAQDNPYAIFGYMEDTTEYLAPQQEKDNWVYLQNTDSTAEVQMLAFDFANGKVRVYNAKDELLDILYFERGDVAFISTDPHWFNYPYQTPYAYVGNNPIMKIDPTGMDEWEINEQGKAVNRITTTKHDAFYIVDKDGKRMDGKSVSFKYGTVTTSLWTKKDFTYDKYDVKGNKNGIKLFEFLADNTKVEWGHIQFYNNKSTITTSHNVKSLTGNKGELLNNFQFRGTIKSETHSHPSGTAYPSGLDTRNTGDIGVARLFAERYGDLQQYIYLPGKDRGVRINYIPYNSNSYYWDFPSYPYVLNGVSVTANR